MLIKIFEPDHYWNNLIDQVRGDELSNLILSNVEDDEARKNDIWTDKFLNEKMELYKDDKDTYRSFFKALEYKRSDEGKIEYELFFTITFVLSMHLLLNRLF